jgi:hypothetical protein
MNKTPLLISFCGSYSYVRWTRIEMSSVGNSIAAAFHLARAKYQEANAHWIRLSFRVGSRLPASLLFLSIQKDGEVDLVIRCMEDELSNNIADGHTDDPLFAGHYLNLLSAYWIGSMYETFRLLRERDLETETGAFAEIFRSLELLRIPLEKHEIAKDRLLDEPLRLIPNPAKGDPTDIYSYSSKDKSRAHIMPMGISSRGSVMWQAIDLRSKDARWIERRALSAQILPLWS